MHLKEFGLPDKDIAALKKKHIHTVNDLLMRFPRGYRDYREVKPIRSCVDGQYSAVSGKLINTEIRSGSKTKYLRLNLTSGTDRFRIDFFVGKYYGYLQKEYSRFVGLDVVVTGKVTVDPVYGMSMSDTEIVPAFSFVPGIKPIYPKNGRMKEEDFLFWLEKAMEGRGELLEKRIRKEEGLMTGEEAFRCMHHPSSWGEIKKAREQFIFYDLLWFELRRRDLESGKPENTSVILSDRALMQAFERKLPFALTSLKDGEKEQPGEGGQREVLNALADTASSGKRIEAVIEGDVGCGKTAVAAAMAMLCAGGGYQAVVMAPKTVLAWQHAKEIGQWCDMMGVPYEVLIGMPKTAAEKKERKASLERIKRGTAKVIIGTHSCFGKTVEYKNAGLIIIDEEQQFGVEQKAALREKALPDAHYIEMSATPVPRSLALSIYGNRDIFRITRKPEGRKDIQTASCVIEETAFRFMEKQLAAGRQCYVVCPMISENEEDGIDGAEKTAERCRLRFEGLGYRVAMADGRMKTKDFEKEIARFKDNEAQILVSTTVVEVGVNVPNATVIVIENAERFGLSQLHQLRGRVGRREYSSYCIMVTQDRENERIKAMESITDGFEIAEKDLMLRGPGDINGIRQSGQDKYVTEALLFPDIHKKAKKAAEKCTDKNKDGLFLRLAYAEHLKYEEE